MSKFRIGQKVVAIRDHSKGVFKKGDVFTVLNCRVKECLCKSLEVDIGIKSHRYNRCLICKSDLVTSSIWWFDEASFAPLQEKSDFTFEQAIELVTQKEINKITWQN